MSNDETRQSGRKSQAGELAPKPKPRPTQQRLERQAQELRANLKRRKAKARIAPTDDAEHGS